MAIVNSIVKNYTKIIAIDTAKNSFQVCVGRTDGEGKVKQYKFSRSKFHDGIVKLGVDGSLLFTVPTAHKNRSMPYKERLPGGFHNRNLSSW